MFRKVIVILGVFIPIITGVTVGAEERMPSRLAVTTLVDRAVLLVGDSFIAMVVSHRCHVNNANL